MSLVVGLFVKGCKSRFCTLFHHGSMAYGAYYLHSNNIDLKQRGRDAVQATTAAGGSLALMTRSAADRALLLIGLGFRV